MHKKSSNSYSRFFARSSIIIAPLFLLHTNAYSTELQTAIAAFNQGNYAEAKSLLEQSSKDAGTKNDALYFLGRIAFEEDKTESAKQYLEKSVALEPNTSDEYYWLGRVYGDLAQKANLFKQASYATNVKKYFQLAIDTDPKNLAAQRGLFAFYVIAPRIMGGSTEKAEATLNTIRTLSVVDADIKAIDLISPKDQAEKRLAQATLLAEKYPNSAEALFTAAMVYRENKKFDEALTNFNRVSQMDITRDNKVLIEHALYHYGETCSWINQHLDEGIEKLQNLLSMKVNDKQFNPSWTNWTLAKLYYLKGDREKYRDLRSHLDAATIKADKWLKEDLEKNDFEKKNNN